MGLPPTGSAVTMAQVELRARAVAQTSQDAVTVVSLEWAGPAAEFHWLHFLPAPAVCETRCHRTSLTVGCPWALSGSRRDLGAPSAPAPAVPPSRDHPMGQPGAGAATLSAGSGSCSD